jgi:DNA-binding MarR family transcriptional regulator
MSKQTAIVEDPEIRTGSLPDLVGYQIRLTQIAVFNDLSAVLAPLAMTPGRLGLLMLVEANPGLAQSRLAESLGLDRSSLVPVLNTMQSQRLLERRPVCDDRRRNGIWLTASGARLLRRLQPLVAQHEERMLQGVSRTQRRLLVTLLLRLRSNLTAG